jgi:vacuolar-type H+-ATPase subunit H
MPGSSRSVTFYIRELQSLRERHCAKALGEARTQAKQIVRPAFQEARLRVRNVLTEERGLLQKRIQAAQARLRAARLQRRDRDQERLLRLACEQLVQTLTDRWRDPPSRRQWVAALLEDGIDRLPPEGWRIRHPEGWNGEELEAARAYLEGRGVRSPAFTRDGDLRAGLCIHLDGVVLDGSVAGLVSDRRRIEARLLALMGTQGGPETDEQSQHPMD